LKNNDGSLQLKRSHQYFYQVQAQLFVTHLLWCDFVVWAPSEDIYLERIYYDQKFNEAAISQARTFYLNTFFAIHSSIADGFYEAPRTSVAPVTTEMLIKNDQCKDVQICCTDLLQQLKCRRHRINGDGNCLYYVVAHQAGYIEHSSHGDTFIGSQLRMLALNSMQRYPGVCVEEGISQHQWEQKHCVFYKKMNGVETLKYAYLPLV